MTDQGRASAGATAAERRTAPVRRRRAVGRSGVGRVAGGQSIVEFALVIPLMLVVMFGIVEFAFVFNAVMSTNFASRAAALLAAEAGNNPGGDCVILRGIEREIGAPADRSRIVTVSIYRSDSNGKQIGDAVTTYARTGTKTCDYGDGDPITVPYERVGVDGYPESDRCNVLLGCPDGPSGHHSGLDTIGVRVRYSHTWRTPLNNFLPGSGDGYTFDRSNAMRIEPVL